MQSVFEKIQSSIADFLSRREFLRGTKVFVDRSSDLEGKIDEKLYQKFGLSVLVKMPSPSSAIVNGGTISFGTVICRVRVFENIPTNQSGFSAAYAAEQILKSLAGYTPEGASSALAPRVDYPWSQITGTATTNAVEVVLTTAATM